MRIRSIKPGFYKDEELAELSPLTRILFTGLWGLADKEGRLEDRPRYIKAEVLPYDKCDVNAMLERLHKDGFIIRYNSPESANTPLGTPLDLPSTPKKYIQICTFGNHQRITGKEAESESQLPPPPHRLRGETPGKQLGINRETPETTGREGSKEGKGKDITLAGSSPAVPPPKPPGQTEIKAYEISTPIQKVVCGWKVITGYAKDDRAWDKAHWSRTARSAQSLLDFFAGDWKAAVDCCQSIREQMEKNKLSCTIETILKHAADWKIKREGVRT